MSAGGPLLNLKLLGFFIFENRNSLEVTLSITFYFKKLDGLQYRQLRTIAGKTYKDNMSHVQLLQSVKFGPNLTCKHWSGFQGFVPLDML
jgi:hypothetical protein